MNYTTTPNKTRTLDQTRAGLNGNDARWRGVPRNVRSIDRLEVLERQRRQRDKKRGQ